MAGRSIPGVFFAILSLAPLASAGEWYVDAANGSDANAGTSPTTAFRTITHAVATIPIGPVQVIHVAPGVYDPTLGEVYPIHWKPHFQLAGAGKGVTILDGGGAADSIVGMTAFVGSPDPFSHGPDSVIRDVTLRNAQQGLNLATNFSPIAPTIESLEITGMAAAGISLSTGNDVGYVAGTFHALAIHDNAVGIRFSNGNNSDPTFTECAITQNTGNGATLISGGQNGSLTFVRCELRHNGGDGLNGQAGGFGATLFVTLQQCVVADNAGDGIELTIVGGNTGASVTLRSSTVAFNGQDGIATFQSTSGAFATLDDSIVYGHAPAHHDLHFGSTPSVHHSDLGESGFEGSNGNIVANPRFVDAASGDYRLRANSPCVDAGDPSHGAAWRIDGNLDAAEVVDMGALELATLVETGTPQLGSTISLDLWGPVGGSTFLAFSPGPPVAPPLATPIGELDLDLASSVALLSGPTAPAPPNSTPLAIPANPVLAGITLTFQGATVPALTPSGVALTNAVSFELLP